MMSLWIGASSGNLFGNIDLRVVKAANRVARLPLLGINKMPTGEP